LYNCSYGILSSQGLQLGSHVKATMNFFME
jgi:hypothetical protein